jgi:predicted GNAT superfamily acetyltransferase
VVPRVTCTVAMQQPFSVALLFHVSLYKVDVHDTEKNGYISPLLYC